MSRLIELKSQLEELQTAQATASALQDISALRMQGIRRGFEKNRAFFEEIKALYSIVKSDTSRASRGQPAKGRPRRAALDSRGRRSGQLFIAITSNRRFFGTLTRDIIDALVRELGAAPEAKAIIVGRVGWQYFQLQGNPKRARQLFFEDDVPTPQEFESLLQLFKEYGRVFVLYPKFINPFRQEAAIEDITYAPDVARETGKTEGAGRSRVAQERKKIAPDADYIFEPEVPAILAFFDTQVRRVLLNRVMLEAELSRTAARLFKMEEAVERADALVAATAIRLRRQRASDSDTQSLETYAGITQWNRQ